MAPWWAKSRPSREARGRRPRSVESNSSPELLSIAICLLELLSQIVVYHSMPTRIVVPNCCLSLDAYSNCYPKLLSITRCLLELLPQIVVYHSMPTRIVVYHSMPTRIVVPNCWFTRSSRSKISSMVAQIAVQAGRPGAEGPVPLSQIVVPNCWFTRSSRFSVHQIYVMCFCSTQSA